MKNLIPVEGKIGLYRDSDSTAIVNKNTHEYNEYIERKKVLSQKNEKITEMKTEIDYLKNELTEIKNMISEITKTVK